MKTCPICPAIFPVDNEVCPHGGFRLLKFRDERECPYCAEKILKKARVCKHYGRDGNPLDKTGPAIRILALATSQPATADDETLAPARWDPRHETGDRIILPLNNEPSLDELPSLHVLQNEALGVTYSRRLDAGNVYSPEGCGPWQRQLTMLSKVDAPNKQKTTSQNNTSRQTSVKPMICDTRCPVGVRQNQSDSNYEERLTGNAIAPSQIAASIVRRTGGQRFIVSKQTSVRLIASLMWFAMFLPMVRAQGESPDSHVQSPRITKGINNSQLARLQGNVPRMARKKYDQGKVASSFEIPYITLMFKPSPDQHEAIDKLLAQQQDKSSPDFHKWLTPQQYGERFGLTKDDLSKVVTWLKAQGFSIKCVANGRNWVAFTGTAGQVERAFHTEIHQYRVNGKEHYANATAPWVPAALRNVMGYIFGLTDFGPKPLYTDGSGNHELAPDDIATIYDINRLYNLSPPIDGTGQSIVVIGESDIDLSDIADFRSRFGLSGNVPQVKLFGADPGFTSAQREADLDLEWVGAVARNATIWYVYSNNVFYPALFAIDHPDMVGNPSVLSFSFGSCEENFDSTFAASLQNLVQEANAEGITWVSGSGDSGAAGCDAQHSGFATSGLAVSIFASVPEVTSVGGTELDEDNGAYWSTQNGPNGGSALSYIPESSWNDTYFYGLPSLGASGGGASVYFQKPSWQVGPGVVSDGFRDVPDVAMAASADHDAYIICTAGDCGNGSPGTTEGGTSAATPVFAGIVALLNQYLGYNNSQTKPGLGNINPKLYQIAQSTKDVFHDITTGNNIVPCLPFSLDCGLSATFGYTAGTGYDEVTGLGSVDAYNLVTEWNPALFVTLSAKPDAGTAPLGTTLTATVSGTAAGTINYTFWWNCDDTDNSVANVLAVCGDPTDSSIGAKFDGVTDNPKTVSHVYSTAGSYTAKVIAEQGSASPAGNQIPITVNTSSLSVSSVTFSSYSVAGGTSVSGTVTLNANAPSSGISVVLTAQPSGIIELPQAVTIPGGSDSGTFTASTSCVPTQTTVTVTASYNSTQSDTTVYVNPQPSSVGVAGLSFDPDTVNSGSSSTGTISLTGTAPSCGAYVTLAANTQGIVQLPPPVTIPSGGTTSTFNVSTLSVSTSTNVTVTASYNKTSSGASITVNPANSAAILSNLTFNPNSIVGGSTASGSISLSGPAPSGGASVTFSSSPSGLLQLSSVTIPAGSTSATFSAPTTSVNSSATVSVVASYGSSSTNATLTLTPSSGSVYLTSLATNPSTVVGGVPSMGIVTLTGPAPQNATVSLSSNNTHFVQVPSTVTVSPGYNNVTFPITTFFTSGSVGATITASYNGTTYGASITVLPVAVSGVTFNPSSVTAGSSAPFTVYLTGPAPAGTSVSLTSSNPSVLQVPPTVNVATGATQISVTGTTGAVSTQTTVSVAANYNLTSGQGSLTVEPAPPLTLNTFNISPTTVTGGVSTTGTVWLTEPAPAGGVNVTISTSSGLAQPPVTVSVAAGAGHATFNIPTSSVSSVTTVTLSASYGGVSQSATLTLVPPLPFLSSLTLSPTTVTSGSPVTGTITLTAAPIQSIVVNTVLNVPVSIASVASSLVIQPGSTSATFTISTSPIKFIAPVTVTLSYNGTTQTASFTIVPPGTPLAPSSLTFSPVTVSGGTSSTGTVILTAPAPSGGAVVTLSSGSSVVEVPLTVTVPAGTNSVIFTGSTSSVSDISTATITASLNGVSQSSLLTVEPSGTPTPANPVPLLVPPLSPVSQTPGGTGFTLTVKGNGFVPGAQLFWGQTALPTTVVSQSEVQGTIPSSTVQSNMSPLLTVVNSGTGRAASNPLPEHLTYPRTTLSFSSSPLSVTGSPFSVAFGDFNGDGKPDMVVGKSDGSGLSIFLGNGDGTFGSERIISVPTQMFEDQVAVGDLNGDGKEDIVYCTGYVIGVLLGNGDGMFTPMPEVTLPVATGDGPVLAFGDLNGDGKLDLVVTGTGLTQVYVLIGNGDGTFSSPVGYGAVNSPLTLALADFNGDGKLDIAVGDTTNQMVAILLGNGDGTFQPQQESPTNGYVYSLVVGDFNGDGYPDLGVAEAGPYGGSESGVAVLLNKGDGTFAAPVNYGAGLGFSSIATDDLDGDGKLDLIAVQEQPAKAILAFLGNGDGTFSTTPTTVTSLATIGPLAVADLNNDGAPDILAPGNSTGSLPIFLQSIGPIIRVTPATLSFASTQGEGNLPQQSLAVSNTGGGTETWSASSSESWLTFDKTSGTAPSTINVSANASGLNPGTYNAAITIASANASNSPQTVPVTLVVNPVSVVVSALSFNPAALTGPGTATGNATLNVPAPVGGIDVTLSSDNTAVQVPNSVTIPAGLTSGTFTAKASAVTKQTNAIVNATYNGVSTSATLTVNPPSPSVGLSVPSMSFGGQIVGTTSAAQSVKVTNDGTASLNFSSMATIGDFAVQKAGTTCSVTSSLAVGTSCIIAVAFAPKSAGSLTGTLTLKDDAPSGLQQVALSGTGEDFALGLASGAASSETVTPGSSTSYSLNVSPKGGFSQTVTLACTGAPKGSTCIVSPTSVTLDGTDAASVKVNVTTTSGSLAVPPAPDPPSVLPAVFCIILLVMGLLATFRFEPRRARVRMALLGPLALLLLSVAFWAASCGGGAGGGTSTTSSSSNATPAGTYTLTVTGTSGSLTHSTTVDLKVQ